MTRRPDRSSITLADQRRALEVVQGQKPWLAQHLDRLAALPRHGNRRLTCDRLLLGLLLAFFDPLARSLRLIEDAGDFRGNLDLPRLARSTTSDALAALDPKCLLPIIQDLHRRLPELRRDPDLASITRQIIAADGTYLTTLSQLAWVLKHTKSDGSKQGQVRLNLQLDVENWTPQVISLSGDDGQSEPAAVMADLLERVLYVIDRNFLDFGFLGQLLARNNDFVLRVRSNAPAVRVLEERELSAADREAGVAHDQVVELTGKGAVAGRFRLVTIQSPNRQGKPETIRLLSSLLSGELSAGQIGLVYLQRWQIELFFKWFKCWARMDHLLSASRNGITFQMYVAVIAVLMMHIQSGRRVSLYSLAALSRLACGQLTLEQAMAVIERREHQRQLDAARQARRRQQKKLA